MAGAAPAGAERRTSGDLRGVLSAGTTLRGYELRSILGQGAFGITYRARDTTLDRDVAIKEYLPTQLALREGRTTVLPRSPDHAEQFAWGRERFLDEARTLARLDRTPAIVRVHDFLEANGTAYMVMTLVEGETLVRRLLREQRLAPEAIERLLFPLLDGLEEVHAIGFLHRDIKPANVMVDGHGRPTLIDFGAARAAMAGRSTTMTAIFTPGYAAAEQYTSAALGPWTDIYGLAATLYHAITGKIPPSSFDRILKETCEPLSELEPEGYAPELLAGIDAGMERHVDDRPQSIAEWRQVLRTGERRSLAQEVTQVDHGARGRARAAARSGKVRVTIGRPALWGAAAAAALLLAGGGYLAFTASAPRPGGAASIDLSTEQLEQVLAERRKADALAADKRRLEEEARQKAEAEAETKRRAEADLDQARQARQKAEAELADLKARIAAGNAGTPRLDQAASAARRGEEDAQLTAAADAAVLRQAEEDARKKVEANAEAKRQADEALAKAGAERQRADQEARLKAEAETAALRQSSEEAQRKAAEADSVRQAEAARVKAEAERARAEADRQKTETEAKARAEAEAAEKALRLEQPDRQRVQVALASLGFDTRGSDGLLGPRSREMIAAWQKARNQSPTGFLTAAQQKALVKEAAPALSKHDEQKKAEEDTKARLAAAVSTKAPSGASPNASDGLWRGTFGCSGGNDDNAPPFTLNVEAGVSNGSGVWYAQNSSHANGNTIRVAITVNGSSVVAIRESRTRGRSATTPLTGHFDGNSMKASSSFCAMALTRDGSPGAVALQPAQPNVAAAAPSAADVLPDGTYTGAFPIDGTLIHLSVQMTGGRGTGTATRPGCGSAPVSLSVGSSGSVMGEGVFYSPSCNRPVVPITGRVDGRRLLLSFTLRDSAALRQVALGQGGSAQADPTPAQPGSAPAPAAAAGQQATTTAPVHAYTQLQPAPSNMRACYLNRLALRLHPNKIEVQMPWGWEALEVGDDGSFSGIVVGPASYVGNTVTATRLSIRGNVRSKDFQAQRLDAFGCAWTGTIS